MSGDEPTHVGGEVLARIEAIEARQRDYGMHDPDCPRRAVQRDQERTGVYLYMPECACWLAAGAARHSPPGVSQ